jgi:ribosome-associated translation inhibitor RaiA
MTNFIYQQTELPDFDLILKMEVTVEFETTNSKMETEVHVKYWLTNQFDADHDGFVYFLIDNSDKIFKKIKKHRKKYIDEDSIAYFDRFEKNLEKFNDSNRNSDLFAGYPYETKAKPCFSNQIIGYCDSSHGGTMTFFQNTDSKTIKVNVREYGFCLLGSYIKRGVKAAKPLPKSKNNKYNIDKDMLNYMIHNMLFGD